MRSPGCRRRSCAANGAAASSTMTATAPATGGIERWLKLAEGVGLDRAYVQSTEGILAGTRFAVEAYVNFVRDRPILEGIASSLTEMFSPGIIADRVRGMLAGYDFITEETLAYFTPRLTQAPQDVDFALSYVKQHATTRGRPGGRPRRPALQVRRAVDAARRAAFRLCRAGPDPARRLRAEPRATDGPLRRFRFERARPSRRTSSSASTRCGSAGSSWRRNG